MAAVNRRERRNTMAKYNAGDGFIIKVTGYIDKYRMYKMTGGCLMGEDYLDGLKKARETLIERGKQEAYEEGMNTAWNLAKRIVGCHERGLNEERRNEAFGRCEAWDVLNLYTAYDAKSCLDDYDAEQREKYRIHEGDVVKILEQTGVVLAIDNEVASVYVLTDEYAKVQELSVNTLEKVGQSIDVRGVLERAYIIEKGTELKDVMDSV